MNKIEELEKAIQERMNQLANQDPTCNRLMGRLDVLREQEPVKPDLKVEKK